MSSSLNDQATDASVQNKSALLSFLKSLANFRGDLSTITAPPSLLSTVSLVEFFAFWAEHPSHFVAPALEPDVRKRALLVLKWYLSTLNQQYLGRRDKLGGKKPLNPFLGETFIGHREDDSGITRLVSEQVSHQPPVTAYCIWNDRHRVRLQGYTAQKASFLGNIHIKQIGHATLCLEEIAENYLITLPTFQIKGLFSGNPYPELSKTTHIYSSTGYTSRISYSGQGWFSGEKNTFTATLFCDGAENKPLYSITGQWSDTFTIKDMKTLEVLETYKIHAHPITPLVVADIEQQDPCESRRAWKPVTDAIRKGDMDAVSREKSKLENVQRESRKKERAECKEFERRFFQRINVFGLFERLGERHGEVLDKNKTAGVWRVILRKSKAPFPADLTPLG